MGKAATKTKPKKGPEKAPEKVKVECLKCDEPRTGPKGNVPSCKCGNGSYRIVG